jgi:hypothetical protein
MEEFRFEDLEPIAIPVTIGKKAYILREATGDDACKWRKYLFRSTKMEGGKPIMSMDTLADSEPLLLSYCMHEEYADKNGETKERKVDLQVIRAWPNRVIRPLFEKAKAISALDEQEQTEEQIVKKIEELKEKLTNIREGSEGNRLKNLQTSTMDGSG